MMYGLVYRKSFHLPVEFKHKGYWAIKRTNSYLKEALMKRNLQINELGKCRNLTYENNKI